MKENNTKNYEASTKETVSNQSEYSIENDFDEYFDEYAEENEAYFKNADMIL